jgi:multimeric flavodoxin WrbA
MTSTTALALNCTLKRSPGRSSCGLMLGHLAERLAGHGVHTDHVRVADHTIHPGVSADEGDGDEWPTIRDQILAADILVLGTPIWLGAPSSLAKRVAERLDAMLGETDDRQRFPTFGKVAVVAVVGNEDGAHHVSAECYQWLADVGFTIPATGTVYWVGEAMGSTDYQDLPEIPETVAGTLDMVASNAAHLAGLLAEARYPGVAAA